MSIRAGYMGKILVGSETFRFESCNLAWKAPVEAPDLVMGHWDHAVSYVGKGISSGTVSGPVTTEFANGAGSVWSWAVKRGTCGELTAEDVEIFYNCDDKTKFTDTYVNGLTISCSAGDLATFSMDLMSGSNDSAGTTTYAKNDKTDIAVTWKDLALTCSGAGNVASFDFTIGNNLNPVYQLGDSAATVLSGLRTISGSVSVYYPDYPTDGTISFVLGTTTISANVRFHSYETTLSVGPVMRTVPFIGAEIQTTINAMT